MFNKLNVHHKLPRHLGGTDDESNLVTLCRQDHFSVGHKRNWTNSVPEIVVLFKTERAKK
jgi:5-methylcytosine-specific restriction endonuclease McrA